MKKVLFYAAMAAIPLAVLAALPFAYYAYQKLTYPYQYCGGYGEIDDALGWKLRVNASSCMSMRNRFTGETYFDSTIYTDELGFRAAAAGAATPTGAIVAIGDSWTFGYAVDYDQSYPHHLERLAGAKVVNMAVPAYGVAQTLLLLERHVGRLKPRAVVYLTQGLWTRSACQGGAGGGGILKPCLRWDPEAGRIELVTPRPGLVRERARMGIFPGGYLTAGHTSWSYFVVSRPWAMARKALAYVGRAVRGQGTPAVPLPEMFSFILGRFLDLARAHGFVFLLVDPTGYYRAAVADLGEEARRPLLYLGPSAWRDEVETPARSLAPEQVRVPRDGHYADGMNRLIAAAVARRLAAAAP